MRKTLILLFAAGTAFPAAALAAPDLVAPDLVGEWISAAGETHGAMAGDSGRGVPAGERLLHGGGGGWSLKIHEVEGRSLRGEWCGRDRCEGLAGVLHGTDGLYAVDEDGIFIGTFRGEVLELCYLEPGREFRIASCRDMRKD